MDSSGERDSPGAESELFLTAWDEVDDTACLFCAAPAEEEEEEVGRGAAAGTFSWPPQLASQNSLNHCVCESERCLVLNRS